MHPLFYSRYPLDRGLGGPQKGEKIFPYLDWNSNPFVVQPIPSIGFGSKRKYLRVTSNYHMNTQVQRTFEIYITVYFIVVRFLQYT
jgi:hypothetical protein